MKYQELLKELRNNIIRPIYYFTGSEVYIAHMMEKAIMDKVIDPGLAQMNTMVFSKIGTEIKDVLDQCIMLPMMSKYRLVVVREEADVFQSPNQKSLEYFLNYAKKPNEETILIIYDQKPDKRKKLGKLLIQTGGEVKFSKLSRGELEKWIAKRLKDGGKTTSRRVVERFIDDTRYLDNEEQNMENIDHELGKLLDFLGERQSLTLKDLDEVLPKAIDDNIFRMMDYAMGGNMGEALIMLNQFYLEGESPFGVFGLLISQLRTMTQVLILEETGKRTQTIATLVKRPIFVVEKLLRRKNKYPKERLIQLMVDSASLDRDMKTGKQDPELGVELFILKLGEPIGKFKR